MKRTGVEKEWRIEEIDTENKEEVLQIKILSKKLQTIRNFEISKEKITKEVTSLFKRGASGSRSKEDSRTSYNPYQEK